MSIELSGTNVLMSICLLAICIVAFIGGVRRIYFLRKKNDILDKGVNFLANRNKYFNISALKNVSFNFRIGLVCSLAFVLLSFSWTTYEEFSLFEITDIGDLEVIEEIPRTIQKPPPPPPPPPPIIEEVPDELITEADIPEFVDQEVTEDVVIDPPIAEPVKEIVKLPPPIPDFEEEIEEIIGIAEIMPRFPGCENLSGSNKEKKVCADKKMLEYIYSKLHYPQMARSNGIEGTVVVQFVVNKEGSVSDINVVRKLGAGCDEAAAKVISDMNKLPERWTPGKQRGRKVKVMYTLPIKFKLLK